MYQDEVREMTIEQIIEEYILICKTLGIEIVIMDKHKPTCCCDCHYYGNTICGECI